MALSVFIQFTDTMIGALALSMAVLSRNRPSRDAREPDDIRTGRLVVQSFPEGRRYSVSTAGGTQVRRAVRA